MLRVTIELVSAVTGKTSVIGRMHVWNDGTGTPSRGNYQVGVRRRGAEELQPGEHPKQNCTRHGEVKNYPRLSYNVWRLILRALKSAFPEEDHRVD